jgi:hypothetical protein
VSRFSVGDAVLGNGRSTLAELAAPKQDYLRAKPGGLSSEQSAWTESGPTPILTRIIYWACCGAVRRAESS